MHGAGLRFQAQPRPPHPPLARAHAKRAGDVVSGVEALETALPSDEPASGLHPHAPATRPASEEAPPQQPAVGGDKIQARWEQLADLVGRRHIFKLHAVV